MKKLLILISILMISAHSFAGEDQTKEDINKYEYALFHLGGLSLGFTFSDYNLDYINNQVNNWNKQGAFLDPIKNGIGYSIGMRLPIWISPKSRYTSGIMGGYEFTRLYAESKSDFLDYSIIYHLPLNVHEFTFLYYKMFIPEFLVYSGIGIGYYSCKGEITAEPTTLNPYRRSTIQGKTMGIRPFLEFQYFVHPHITIQTQLGYRWAKINDLEEDVSANSATLDWSGMTFRIGVVLYLISSA